MFRRIIRFIGTTFGLLLMFATIALLTFCLDMATKGILANEACVAGIEEIRVDAQSLGAFSFLHGIICGFFDFLYNEGLRNAVVFIIILWLLSFKALSGSQMPNENRMNYYTWNMVKRICIKMTTFPTKWWISVIFAVTLYVPVILVYTLASCLLIVGWFANILLAPISYILLSYCVALTSK